MSTELQRDRDKIQAMKTEDIERGLDLQTWGQEPRKIAESELDRRKAAALREATTKNVEATQMLVKQTGLLVDATRQLVNEARNTSTATRFLAWATFALFLSTVALVVLTALRQ